MDCISVFKVCTCLVAALTFFCIARQSAIGAETSTAESLRFAVTRGVSLPKSMGGQAAGLVDGVPVVTGGNDWVAGPKKVWRNTTYVFRNGRWSEGPELPRALAHPAFAHDQNGFYVAGGSDSDHQFADVFRLASLGPSTRWEKLTPLPVAVSSAAGACLQRRFYVVSGETGGDMTRRMWSLDVREPGASWKPCRDVPGTPRTLAALVAVGKHLYLLGGVSNWTPLTPMAECLRYDPAADTWERMKDLPFSGYAWSASPVDGAHVLLAGCADGRIRPDIWLLNLEKVSASKVGNAILQTTTAPLLRIGDHEWWLLGGEPDSNRHRTPIVTRIRAGAADSSPAAASE